MMTKVGMAVRAYSGSCIGCVIQSTEYLGEIVKANKKSIRVKLTETTSKYGKKITNHQEGMNREVAFRFTKTLSNGKDLYTSEGRLYGIIEI